jgi:hypothetical protein
VGINRVQQLRIVSCKGFNNDLDTGDFQLNFVGMNVRDKELITSSLVYIRTNGFSAWKDKKIV